VKFETVKPLKRLKRYCDEALILSMKKTSNPPSPGTGYAVASTQRRTLNIEWSADGRLRKLGQPANLAVCRAEIEELIRIFAANVRTAAKK
jgi:hypothetical protein